MTVDAAIRVPPHSFEAEQQLLGAILMNNRAFDAVADFLRGEHFAEPTHGRIFEECRRLIDSGRRADPVVLRQIMAEDEGLKSLGGDTYLAAVAAAAAPMAYAADHGRLVFDLFKRREIIAIAEDMAAAAYDLSDNSSADQVQEGAEAQLLQLSSQGQTGKGLQGLKGFSAGALAQMEAAYKNRGRITGLTTGLKDLDNKLGGLRPSDLVILAARPAMGKTSLATCIAINAARAGSPVGIFSMEMSGEQLAARILSAEAGVSAFKALQGETTAEEMERLWEADQTIKSIPVHIDETGARTVIGMRAEARRMARRHGLGLVIVDYIGLAAPANPQRNRQKVHEIEEITNGLKAMAKELKVPVLALCQLSRGVEQREDKRPMLSDLRDSGAIEQDADAVLFLYREEYYLRQSEPADGRKWGEWKTKLDDCANTAEVIIAKHRHGPTGAVKMFFDGALTKFGNLDHGGGNDDF